MNLKFLTNKRLKYLKVDENCFLKLLKIKKAYQNSTLICLDKYCIKFKIVLIDF